MGRFVKRGEKGIRILAPAPYKLEQERDKMDDKGRAVLDKDGEPVRETVQINITAFKPVSTFDLSQTEGEPLPSIGVSELTGSVEGYAKLFEAITAASPVPIGFENIEGGAKGYFHTGENRIAIQEGMGEIQTVKTAIHEMAHAKLHNMEAQKAREDGGQTRSSKEVEAESVAYTVCQHFGIDTSDYSFAYVAGWSHGKEMPELKESLNTIRTAASELITAIDEKVQALTLEKSQEKEEQTAEADSTKKTEMLSGSQTENSNSEMKEAKGFEGQTSKEDRKAKEQTDPDQPVTSERKPSVRKKLHEEKEKRTEKKSDAPTKTEKTKTRNPRTKHKEEIR